MANEVEDIGIIDCECHSVNESEGRNCGCEYYDQYGNKVGESDVRNTKIRQDQEIPPALR